MGFLKKLFGFGKKEEVKVDEEVIEKSIENKENNDKIINEPVEIDNKNSIGVDYNNAAEVIDKPLEITDEVSDEDKEEINDESTQPRNFKYLDDLIHSGVKEIVLGADITLDYGEEFDYKEGIELDVDDLVIDGNGFTIDAKGKTRIFCCTGKNITIKNIILKNGFYDDGGAIFNKGELTIADSILRENTAQGTLGGGAIFNKGELTIIDSTLNKNTAQRIGGAIHNWEGLLTITDSTFCGNSAQKGAGGAIVNNEGISKVFNCVFSDNDSQMNIIYTNDSLQIYNSDFISNCANNVIVSDEDLSNIGILYGKFKDNDINESVIFNNGKSCTVEKSIFENNNSNNIINKSDLILINPKIKEESKTILNEGCVFIKKSPDELENKIFGGGRIENESKFMFKEFDFGYLDKKIQKSTTNEIIIEEDISFENYEVDYYEGGIGLDIDNLIIDGNGHTIDAKGKTRIFHCTGKNITIKNLTLKNGHSHKNHDNPFNSNGGAIKINHNANLTIINCKFTNNMSEEDSGAIFNMGELTIIGSTLCENNAQGEWGMGGAIFNRGELTIMNSTFNENIAKGGGGAIFNPEGILSITDSTFIKNIAHGVVYTGGGAIYNWDMLIITDSTLNENYAWNGGAIYNEDGTLNITDSTLNENLAELGGAIYHSGTKVTLSDSTLEGNTAEKDGGATYLKKFSNYESNNCTFKDNKPNDVYKSKY